MSREESAIQVRWLDSLMVFLLVIAVGSICAVVLLRDVGRYWSSVGARLEAVGSVPAPSPSATPAPRPTPR